MSCVGSWGASIATCAAMTLADFYIGCEFTSAYRSAQLYRCTDIGTRVIVATAVLDVEIEAGHAMEFVFQPFEFEHCELAPI